MKPSFNPFASQDTAEFKKARLASEEVGLPDYSFIKKSAEVNSKVDSQKENPDQAYKKQW